VDLRTYLTILRRRKAVIAVTTVAALLAAAIGTLLMPPVYAATTTLRVTTAASLSGDSVSYDSIMYATRLLNTYAKIATGDSALDELSRRLALGQRPKVRVDVPANSELIRISVESRDPAVAAEATRTLVDILMARAREAPTTAAQGARQALAARLAQMDDELRAARAAGQELPGSDASGAATATRRSLELLEERYARLADQYERARLAEAVRSEPLSVLEPATVPEAPVSPGRALTIAVALLLGLVGGTGLAFLIEHLDPRLYTARHIEDVVNLSVLGAVPATPRARPGGLFDPDSPAQEAIRRVRARVLESDRDASRRSVLVTSAEPGEGKSTVAANLAVSIAQTGRATVVVDGDLRLPAQHRIFDLPNEVGLSSVLRRDATVAAALQASQFAGVRVITSGPTPPNPAELLGSSEMVAVLAELAGSFDVIVLDAPSLLAVADALVLARAVDGVVLVVGRAQARAETVRAAREELISARARSIGVVVNRAELDASHAYYRRVAVGA
jgi:capsular exopolysaccharide synthesis family protein